MLASFLLNVSPEGCAASRCMLPMCGSARRRSLRSAVAEQFEVLWPFNLEQAKQAPFQSGEQMIDEQESAQHLILQFHDYRAARCHRWPLDTGQGWAGQRHLVIDTVKLLADEMK